MRSPASSRPFPANFRRLAAFLLAAFLSFALCLPGCTTASDSAADPRATTAQTEPGNTTANRADQDSATASHLTFRTEEKLQQHFDKHGWETGTANPGEYLAAANAVIASPDAEHKLQAEDGDDLYYLDLTGEFVVVSPEGYIRTYFIADHAYFERQ